MPIITRYISTGVLSEYTNQYKFSMAKGLFYHFAEPSKNRNLQVKYEIDKILNSDLPITSEVLIN